MLYLINFVMFVITIITIANIIKKAKKEAAETTTTEEILDKAEVLDLDKKIQNIVWLKEEDINAIQSSAEKNPSQSNLLFLYSKIEEEENAAEYAAKKEVLSSLETKCKKYCISTNKEEILKISIINAKNIDELNTISLGVKQLKGKLRA